MSWPLLFAGILSFIIIMYVLLDGFDLGIGILFICIKDCAERDRMMNTIIPVWDGNETWLVLGGSILYAAFPLAYSLLLPTLYLPIIIMLIALVFRGVIFEFRFKVNAPRIWWDRLFFVSSLITAFMQGVILGTFVKGYGSNVPLSIHTFHWLTPFSVMTGIAVITGYALLGATWLIMRTDQLLQQKMFRAAKILLIMMGFFMMLVSLWTPLIEPKIAVRWFSYPNIIYLMPLPLFSLLAFIANFYVLNKRYEIWPFILVISIFIFAYTGFVISDWPYIVPHAVTFWDAAAPDSSLKFIFTGLVILLPVLIGYTIYAYYIFRGKELHFEHY